MIFQIYKSKDGQYRWRLKAPNGNIIADSSESYRNKADALRGIEIVKSEATGRAVLFDTTAKEMPEEPVIEDVQIREEE